MEDPTTGDPLFPPSFVTIHHLREQWHHRRQPQGQKQLEAGRRSSPPGKSLQGPAQEDRRKQPERELSRRDTDVERERVKASRWNQSDSRPSPQEQKQLEAGRRSSPPGNSLQGPAQEDRRKQPERELSRRETDVERERVKASQWNQSDSRPSPQGQKQLEAGRRSSPPGNSLQGPAQEDRRKQPERELSRRETDVERERVKASQCIQSDSRPSPQGQKPLEAGRRSSPPGKSLQGPAQEDRRKQPERELSRRETDVERERVKASQCNQSDSRPSPANGRAVPWNTNAKEGGGDRQAVDSNGPKPADKSSRGECACFGADEKAESALVKDSRKPGQELPLGARHAEREIEKANPRNASDSRPAPAICWAVRRRTSVKEGSDGQAIGSNGPKTLGKSSPGKCGGFGADEKAEWALVRDQRNQPKKELLQGEVNTERERMKASLWNESDSRPSPANSRVRRNTSVKGGSHGLQATNSNGPKPLEKSSEGEYAGFGADDKAESTLAAAVSGVDENAGQVKKTEESEKRNRKKSKKSKQRKGKGRSNEDLVRTREVGPRPEEGEVNEPVEEVKKEKFERARSEDPKVMPESKEVREEAKPEEGIMHTPAKEAEKLFQHASSESESTMLESKEARVEVENVAANASHVRAKAEGLNKQAWAVNSKVEIRGELRNLSSQYDSKNVGGFHWRRSNGRDLRPNGRDRTYYGVIDVKEQIVKKQSSDMVWVRKEDISDGHAGESSS